MPSCRQCGAALPANAAWCGQCYLPVSAPAATPMYADVAPAGLASTPPSVYAPAAAPPPPAYPPPAYPPSAYPPPPPPYPPSAHPPGAWAPPPGQVPAAVVEDHFVGRLLDRRAVILVVIAIGIGGAVQLFALALGHRPGIEPDTLIRYDLVLTISFYAVVAALIASQVTPSVRLRWGDGPLATRIGFGLAIGAGFGLVVLALASAAAHHLQSDPRVMLLMSEGDATHILVTVLITCVAAPVVEEILFRGLLLESLRPRGTALAIVVSAGAFAVWHFIPSALIYYTLLGAALGRIYVKKGLASSMATHFGFNAVLTGVAISLVTGPAHVVQFDGLTIDAPAGWSRPASVNPYTQQMLLTGPADAVLAVAYGPPVPGITAASVARVLRGANLPSETVVPAGAEVTQHPIAGGVLVEVPLLIGGHAATMAIADGSDRSFRMVFISAGSTKATSDFTAMMTSLTVT